MKSVAPDRISSDDEFASNERRFVLIMDTNPYGVCQDATVAAATLQNDINDRSHIRLCSKLLREWRVDRMFLEY